MKAPSTDASRRIYSYTCALVEPKPGGEDRLQMSISEGGACGAGSLGTTGRSNRGMMDGSALDPGGWSTSR